MIKLKIKDKGKDVVTDYKHKNTSIFEHLCGICSLYLAIKKYANIEDEDIIEFVKLCTKGDM